jgi:mono/diheme cytochrome c family protein
MKRHSMVMAFAAICAATSAHAADAESGRRLAQSQCAACHIVAPGQREEVAQAPPFETIARKYGANSELLVAAIRGPHPKMNFAPTRRQTDDLAAYVSTLGR